MNVKVKKLIMIAGGVALFGAGVLGGSMYANRNLGIQGELRDARKKLDANYTGAQSEMTTLSEFQFSLVWMELYHVRYTIWNQPNYEKIEAAFQKDEQAWEALFRKEQEKPSEFEGGSMAPMDHNLRMIAFVEKRIAELKTKWCSR
jgi:uncharacterized protein YecT (DUF1311 family)